MKLINWYWTDENNNQWHRRLYTEEEAQKCSKSLVNCYHCENCRDCEDCLDCEGCQSCQDCNHCICCLRCEDCFDCQGCQDCKGCKHCKACFDCQCCMICEGCIDFQDNPQRYVTGRIGNYNDQITFYWLNNQTRVRCETFYGTLEEFEAKVKEVHDSNEPGQAFMAEIEIAKVRMLMLMQQGGKL